MRFGNKQDVPWSWPITAVVVLALSGGCNLSLRHPPSNANPAEKRIVSALEPRIENVSWNKAGRVDSIFLAGDGVTDKDLAQLATLTELWEVNVSNTDITDEGVAHLSRLPRLAAVGLSWTQVTDRSLESLASVESLSTLVLDHTKITDASVEPIGRMKNLTHLFVTGTQLTDEGVASIKNKLPNCLIQK
jgi:hypothetical protein